MAASFELIVTPVLAGGQDDDGVHTKKDASGRIQHLKDEPRKLRYERLRLPRTAPHHDEVVQAVGQSMLHAEIDETELLLVRQTDPTKLVVGSIVLVRSRDPAGQAGWRSLRRIVALGRDKVGCDSRSKSGELLNEELSFDAILGHAVGKFKMPSRVRCVPVG